MWKGIGRAGKLLGDEQLRPMSRGSAVRQEREVGLWLKFKILDWAR